MKPEFSIFVISDNHFLHEKIISYCTRPFANKDEQDEKMRRIWNATVKENDIVIHLGDLVFTAGQSEKVKYILNSLNGRIILVRGNHDRKSMNYYLSNGIDFMCDRFVWDFNGKRILFVHNPAHVSNEDLEKYDYILHGHQHNNTPFITKNGKAIMVNLSVENLDYRPMQLITLLNRLSQKYYDKRRNA